MGHEKLAGAIGIIFGRTQGECLKGDFMGSIAESMDGRRGNGRNRWRPNGHTTASQIDLACLSGSPIGRELRVARDHHSRSRYGNPRS